MIIKTFRPFIGQHCETTAAGCLLKQIDLEFSEPMLFGLGQGLGYLFWKMKMMDFPFIGGRIKPDLLTKNLCVNLNLDLEIKETASINKAWENASNLILEGSAVGLKLDCYHLDYFTNKIHFAGHYVTMYGFDSEYAYLVDTKQQGSKAKTTLKNLELARNEKGSMSSKNLSYIIKKRKKSADLNAAIKQAIFNNASDYLSPPIKNFGYKGIEKTANELQKWFNTSQDIAGDFTTTAMLMERAGTGGALFRNLYRDFLKESYERLKMDGLLEGYKAFIEIAKKWTKVAELFSLTGQTKNIEHINVASKILIEISEGERQIMAVLKSTCST